MNDSSKTLSSNFDPGSLVLSDGVHRSVYKDPAIFDLEMERISGRAWIYIGHESEVAEKGDYITRLVGRRPVILSRHSDGNVYVIHNSCDHRGAKVCVAAQEMRGHFAVLTTAGLLSLMETLMLFPRPEALEKNGLGGSFFRYAQASHGGKLPRLCVCMP